MKKQQYYKDSFNRLKYKSLNYLSVRVITFKFTYI